jgi:hypothetical protein
MLTLAVTLLAALYFYAPGIIYRLTLKKALRKEDALKEPSTTLQQVTEALYWLPFGALFTTAWIWFGRVFANSALANVAGTLVDWLNGHSTYALGSVYLDACIQAFVWQNLQLLLPLYLGVGLFSGAIFATLRHTRRLRHTPAGRAAVGTALAFTPSIAEWHIQLQGMFVPRGLEIHTDVLTKTGGLYRGEVADFALESSGSIRTLTLKRPARFRRGAFDERRRTHPHVRSELFWKPIPGDNFVVIGSDIVNVNVRYVRQSAVPGKAVGSMDAKLLRVLLDEASHP